MTDTIKNSQIFINQFFEEKKKFFHSFRQLQEVVIQDREYRYIISFLDKHIDYIHGSKKVSGKYMPLFSTEMQEGDTDLRWRVQGEIPVISLQSEGKWAHFSFNTNGIYQISNASAGRSFFDRQILHVAYENGMSELSDKPVWIDGVDSMMNRNRQQDVAAWKQQVQKLQIIAALSHIDTEKLNFIHTLVTQGARE